jgi:hypothetical protein
MTLPVTAVDYTTIYSNPAAIYFATARDNLAQLIQQETALMLTNGPRPQYSLDGESFSWDEWMLKCGERITYFNDALQRLDDPAFMIEARGVS